jgi:hypothetical protein
MRATRPIFVAIFVAITTLSWAAPASARTLVDPTSLTPPLMPFRICYQLGPYVQCDTSGDSTYENQEAGDFGCGTIYESAEDISNSTRWYQDGLIVRRAVQERSRGFWSLSPTGAGPIVEFQRDFSWDEHFSIPGDITSTERIVKGATLRVPVLGAELHESGYSVVDADDQRGRFVNDDAHYGLLCPFLVG